MKKTLVFLSILNILVTTAYGSESSFSHNEKSNNFNLKSRFRSADKIKKSKKKKQENIARDLCIYYVGIIFIGTLACNAIDIDVRSNFNSLLSKYIEYNKINEISSKLKNYLVEQMSQVQKSLNESNIRFSEDILFPLSLLKIFNLYSVFESMKKNDIENFIFKLESNNYATNKIDFYISSDESTYGKESRSKTDRLDSNHEFKKSWYASSFCSKTKDFCDLVDDRFWTNFKSCKFTEEFLKLLKEFTFKFSIKKYENTFSFSSGKNNDYVSFDLSNKLVL